MLNELIQEANILSNNIQTLKDNIITTEDNILASEQKLKIKDQAKDILTILKNHKMETKKEFILETINSALTDVFEQNVRINIEASTSTSSGKLNMKYDIVLYQNDIEMARNEKLLGNNGGGILSFISILFKILVGYIYSNNKFYLFDESISQVSPQYRPQLAKFLQTFCEQYNFTIVLISQTDDTDEFADLCYLLDGDYDDKGTPILKIAKTIGTYPEDNYIYTKIENFQSITKLEFRYKGLVIIRGRNNIGKSASFRAVNSLLFNTFDAKQHPRKNRKKGSIVYIEFGKVNEGIIDNIILTFKSPKVSYEFNNEIYTGKSLAFEKIKEKVENIGFKYVNLKDTYKNFKGNLKDQTERLAVTNQYDGFYLIGNKTNETEKVFNFLFDSTEVAFAIVDINNDINDLNNQLNIMSNNIIDYKRELNESTLKYDITLLKYYIELIKEYTNNKIIFDKLSIKSNIINDIITDINIYISIIENLQLLNDYRIQLESLKRSNISTQYNIVNDIINYKECNQQINSFILMKSQLSNFNNQIISISNKINIIDNLIIFNEYKDQIDRFIELKHYLDKLKYDQICHNTEIDNINKILKNKAEIENLKNIIISINNLIYNKRLIESLKSKVINYNKMIDIIDDNMVSVEMLKILNTDQYQKDLNNLEDLESSRIILMEQIHSLHHEFGIKECPHCNGTGFENIS